MANTNVANQGLGVATTTTPHVARTEGPTDVCWNPPVKVAVPHPNSVPTTRATEHSSQKTTFTDGLVVRVGDAIGPPSDPAHGDTGAGGGTGSHTYRKEARATKGSPDVKVEDKYVARLTDPTTQNHANTVGKIYDMNLLAQLEAEEARKLKACTIDVVTAECGHGRALGDLKFLEVLDSDSVKIEGKRINALEAGKPTQCAHPVHTHWFVVRSGGDMLNPAYKRVEEFHGDKLTLGKDWFEIKGSGFTDPTKPKPEAANQKTTTTNTRTGGESYKDPKNLDVNGDPKADNDKRTIGSKDWKGEPSKAAENQEKWGNPSETKDKGRYPTDPSGTPRTDAVRADQPDPGRRAFLGLPPAKDESARIEKLNADELKANAKDAKKNAEKRDQAKQATNLRAAETVAKDLAEFIRFWQILRNPPTVDVTGIACSGSKNFTLRAFPKTALTFDFSGPEIQDKIAKLRSIARVFETIGDYCGRKIQAEFFTGLDINIKCQYKELTKDVNARLTKNSVNRAWTLQFKVGTLIGLSAEFTVAILAFFGPLGGTAASVLSFIGVEGVVGVKISVAIGIDMQGTWDEYDKGTKSITAPVKIEVGFVCKLKFRSVELSLFAGTQVTLEFDDARASKDKIIEFHNKPGEVKIGVKGTLKADYVGFRDPRSLEIWPESWKHTIPDSWFQPFGPW